MPNEICANCYAVKNEHTGGHGCGHFAPSGRFAVPAAFLEAVRGYIQRTRRDILEGDKMLCHFERFEREIRPMLDQIKGA